jgi:osmotically-inducible protein OsmY
MRVTLAAGAFAAPCAGALLAVACSTIGPKPPGEQAADEVLAERVCAQLNTDPLYYYRHVDVTVDDGVADLSGYVWSTQALYRARQITLGVPGVRRVVTSHLELEREGLTRGSSR